jgi:hypothetical protein
VLFACGCRQLYGLGTPVIGDANDAHVAIDVPPPDVPCHGSTAQLVADDELIPGSPTINFGTVTAINIGATLGDHALFHFDISMVPPVTRWSGFSLLLPYAVAEEECAMQCGSCMSLEHDGKLHLYAMRSDWNEAHATWEQRDTGLSWIGAGASGTGDVSADLLAVQHLAGTDTMFVAGAQVMAGVVPWATSSDLTFQIRPDPIDGTVDIVRARESSCGNGKPVATLVVFTCP